MFSLPTSASNPDSSSPVFSFGAPPTKTDSSSLFSFGAPTGNRQLTPAQPWRAPWEHAPTVTAQKKEEDKEEDEGGEDAEGESVEDEEEEDGKEEEEEKSGEEESGEEEEEEEEEEESGEWEKEVEAFFDLPAHERPLTAKETEELKTLSNAQKWKLTESFRSEIEAEARLSHKAARDELIAEMQTNLDQRLAAERAAMQTNLDERLAAERAKWEAEEREWKAQADSAVTDAAAAIARLEKKLETMEQDSLASFRNGVEEGERMGEMERRRLLEVASRLERDLEASNAKLEREQNTSQAAKETIRSLKDREAELLRRNEEFTATSEWQTRDSSRRAAREEELRASLKKAEMAVEAAKIKERDMKRVRRMEMEEAAKKAAEEGGVRDAAASSRKAGTGERGMDSPLGATKETTEGLLRPQIPRWNSVSFWLVVGFLLLLVMGISAAIGAARERQLWVGGTRRAVLSLHAGQVPWKDLLLDLTSEVYGGGG